VSYVHNNTGNSRRTIAVVADKAAFVLYNMGILIVSPIPLVRSGASGYGMGSVDFWHAEIAEFCLVFVLVDSAPDVGVALHEVLDAVAVAEAVVGVDGLGDVDGVLLDGEAGLVELFGVLHGDEAGEDGDIGLAGEDVGAALEGLGLAVVPPHALLGVDEDEVAFLEQRRRGVEELLHGLEVG